MNGLTDHARIVPPVATGRRGQWGRTTPLRLPTAMELLPLDNPAVDGLVEIERARHGHMRLLIFEAGLLQGAVGRHVEGVGFAEQPLQLQPLEIEINRETDAGRADT